MTFAVLPGAAAEFNDIAFNSGASTVTFTMATNRLIWSGTLSVQGGAGATTLATSDLTLTGGALTIGDAGILTANASAVSASNVAMTGGASGTLTLTTGAWTVTGNWDTSGAGSTFTGGASTLTMSGAGATVKLLKAPKGFAPLTVRRTGPAALALTTRGRVLTGGTLDVGGTLTISGGAGTTTLNTSGSNLAINAVTLVVNAGGALTANGSTITVTSMDTHLGTFTVGASNVVVNASGGSMNITQTVNNLTVSPAVSTTFAGSLTWTGTLAFTNAGTVAFGTNSLTSSGASTFTFASATITMSSGDWDTSSATTFTATSSTVTFSGTGNLRIGGSAPEFYNVTFNSGASTVTFTMTTNALAWSGILTVQGGGGATTLATSNLGLIGGVITVGNAGVLAANASAVSVSGLTMIGGASGTLTLTTGSWAVSGNWNTSGAGSVFAKGTSTVTLTGAGQTVSLLYTSNGVYNLAVSGTVTHSTALDVTNSLTVSGTLTTGGFNITGGSNLVVPDGGTLAAGTSTSTFTNVTMTGAVSGTITLAGTWTVSGSWDSTGAGSVLNSGTSTVTFTGTSQTISLASGQMFHNLTIGGTVSVNSSVAAAATLTVNNGAVLTKTGQSIAFNTLTQNGSGSIVDGAITGVNLSVTNSDGTNLTAISVFTTWTIDADYTWTHSSTVATSTITFTIGGNTIGHRFNVTKDAVDFTNGFVNGSGQIIFTMLGSDPVVDVRLTSPCGGNRYWIV